jgi:hypothetical protein
MPLFRYWHYTNCCRRVVRRFTNRDSCRSEGPVHESYISIRHTVFAAVSSFKTPIPSSWHLSNILFFCKLDWIVWIGHRCLALLALNERFWPATQGGMVSVRSAMDQRNPSSHKTHTSRGVYVLFPALALNSGHLFGIQTIVTWLACHLGGDDKSGGEPFFIVFTRTSATAMRRIWLRTSREIILFYICWGQYTLL